jgi:hypothetical protein
MRGAYETFGKSVISSRGKSILCQNVKLCIWKGGSRVPWSHHIQKRSQIRPQENHGIHRMA